MIDEKTEELRRAIARAQEIRIEDGRVMQVLRGEKTVWQAVREDGERGLREKGR